MYFYTFLEGQVHEDSKLGIISNVGKSRLVKVIFTKIHKINDVCALPFYMTDFLLRKYSFMTFEEK